jgi:TonB family protein
MTTAISLFQGPLGQALTHALGWTLLHFLWQGALVAVVLWCALALMERRSADARYAAASLALLAMVALPLLTFAHLANEEYRTTLAQAAFVDAGSILIHAGADAGPTSWSARITFALDRNMPWLMLVWCAGVLVFSCRLAVGMAVAHGWKLQGIQSAPARLQSVFDNLRTRLGVRRAARLVESARVHVPTVIGWLKPVVLLPAGCLVGMSEQQVEALLAHELAHICRNDYLVSVVQSVVEAVLFYHPAVWWVSRQVRREREYCCDEMAVGVCGDRLAYARALSLLEEQRALLPEVVLGANGGVLTMRIKRLLGCREEMASSNMAWVIVLVIVIAGGGSIIGRFALAESKSASAVAASKPSEQAAASAAQAQAQAQDAEKQLDSAAHQAETVHTQLQQAQEALGKASSDPATLSDEDRKQLEAARQQVKAALKNLNTDEIRKQMDEVRRQLNSAEFQKQIQEATDAAKKVNSADIQKQMTEMKKQMAQSRELQQKIQVEIQKQLNSPEFRKQMEQAKAAAAKVNTPEFRKQMEQAKAAAAKVNTPEFRKQMEQAKAAAAKVNTPEFRKQMEQLKQQAAEFNTPEFREKIKRMAEAASDQQHDAEVASNAAPVNEPGATTNPPAAEDRTIRVSSGVMAGQAVSQPQPVYPAEVKAAHIQGTVTLRAVISKDGSVERLTVVSGPKELMRSAIDAVSQWKYKPYLLNGQPVEVETTVNVNYTLPDASPSPNPSPSPDASPNPSPSPQSNAAPAGSGKSMPELVYKMEPKYTAKARKAKVQGIVLVAMVVNAQGVPADVKVIKSLDPKLDENAIKAAKAYRFKPAVENGKPVAKPIKVEVNYQIF